MPGGQFLVSYEKSEPTIWKREKITQQFTEWLKQRYGFLRHEWAYLDISPLLMVESFIQDDFGKQLTEIKAYCFNSQPKHYHLGVNSEITYLTPLDEDLNVLDLKCAHRDHLPSHITDHLIQVIEDQGVRSLAKKLSGPFKFARVDFYWSGTSLYFSEITHYPFSGTLRFAPNDFDLMLGAEYCL